MNALEVDTPTVDALVPLVPELVVFLLVVGIVAALGYAILRVHERELERRGELLDAMRESRADRAARPADDPQAVEQLDDDPLP